MKEHDAGYTRSKCPRDAARWGGWRGAGVSVTFSVVRSIPPTAAVAPLDNAPLDLRGPSFFFSIAGFFAAVTADVTGAGAGAGAGAGTWVAGGTGTVGTW